MKPQSSQTCVPSPDAFIFKHLNYLVSFMPYKSEAQRKWAHTEKGTKALGGKKAVSEWDSASKGKKLPKKKK